MSNLPLTNVQHLIGDLDEWRDARRRKDLDARPLEYAIKHLRDYSHILAGKGTLTCPQGHEYDLHSVDPCDIPF